MTDKLVEMDEKEMKGDEKSAQSRKKLRGKALKKIKEQMEFYFSYANVRRDVFLRNLMQENSDGYVHLEVFLTFNRIKALTTDINDIAKAISDSEYLEVSSDKTKVHMKHLVQLPEHNVDDCTIYVERLPQFSDDKYITNIFNRFGKINYVKLPKFRSSGPRSKIKGFAFIEFNTPEAAKRACEAYKTTDECKEKSHVDEVPEQKLSVTKKKSADFSPLKKDSQKTPKKRKYSENEESPEKSSNVGHSASDETKATSESEETHGQSKMHAKKHKKRKRQYSESECGEKRHKKSFCDDSMNSSLKSDKVVIREKKVSESETTDKMTACDHKLSGVDTGVVEEQPSKKPKLENLSEVKAEKETKDSSEKKNETQKMEVKAEDVEKSEEEKQKRKKRKRKKKDDSEKTKLRVLSKTEWKTYRNKYLTMQKKAMSAVKKMLILSKTQQAECEALLQKTGEHVEEPEEKEHVSLSETRFQPDVIVKIALLEEADTPAELMHSIKSKVVDVAFVDVMEDKKEVFLRFHNSAASSDALKSDVLHPFGSANLVTGDEETAYWNKIQKDRELHYNRTRPNRRGRDKIIAKATALMKQKSTHVHFDESF